jgi:hypothetical protein
MLLAGKSGISLTGGRCCKFIFESPGLVRGYYCFSVCEMRLCGFNLLSMCWQGKGQEVGCLLVFRVEVFTSNSP